MNRSAFFHQIAYGTFGATILPKDVISSFLQMSAVSDPLYVGCYTSSPQEGIPVCSFDPNNGEIQSIDECREVKNPSYLIYSNTRKYIYAVNETDDFRDHHSGSVSAFLRDEKSGLLTFLNAVPTLGAHPCHLTIDATGRFILVANYSSGNVSVLPVLKDGQLGEAVCMVQHDGKGPVNSRQECAHAHSVNLAPDNRFAIVCDLGTDKIMIYHFDQFSGKLTPAGIPFFQTAPGAGPRHFVFSQDGKNAFAVNELNSTITFFRYDTPSGALTELHTLSTLAPDITVANTCADIHLSPDGRFVYASNRGHNSIAVFQIDRESGKLNTVQHQSTLGKTPRNFTIHSSGKFLLAANQDSNDIQVFSVDQATGKLSKTGKFININKPVCLLL